MSHRRKVLFNGSGQPINGSPDPSDAVVPANLPPAMRQSVLAKVGLPVGWMLLTESEVNTVEASVRKLNALLTTANELLGRVDDVKEPGEALLAEISAYVNQSPKLESPEGPKKA